MSLDYERTNPVAMVTSSNDFSEGNKAMMEVVISGNSNEE